MGYRRVLGLLCFVALLFMVTAGRPAPASAEQSPLEERLSYGTSQWDNSTCLGCHNKPGLSTELPSGERLDTTIDESRWHASIHAYWNMKCILCHTEVTSVPHDPPTAKNLRQYAIQQSESCTVCHIEQATKTTDGVHAAAREQGIEEAAVCSDCHDPHYVINPPIPHADIPKTCRKCHAEIYDRYEESVHGSALTDGNPDVPTCTDCHGIHEIEGPINSPFRLFSPLICKKCHADKEMMDKYGIRTDVFSTYVADFHGRTVILFEDLAPGQETNTPVCVSCHGVHDIIPPGDPASTVYKTNLLTTCRRCHPDADANFPTAWMSHYTATPEEWPLVYYAKLFYRILIPTVIGGMLLYVIIDVVGRYRERRRTRREVRDV
ncbi:MAG: cytochrome C [Gammaproteobacteria bacterium]|nr:cytochrome C [Gammaproteobacteria bacterium]